jgi:hypothetical protein
MRKVVTIPVMGFEACPWSVPTITKWGACVRKKKTNLAKGVLNLADWQERVRVAARTAMEGLPLLLGPVRLHFEFYAKTPKGHRDGELWGVNVRWSEKANKGEGGWVKDAPRGRAESDLLNLAKGTEDSLQGIVFANDVQARIRSEIALYGRDAGARITVYAIEHGDFPGIGEIIK